ncbi:MAG: ribonuclease HII [Candidatus Nealsonbacteria bacterium]|nr:ribonuclease HII [Candidatus Nealsonbacteria bacterium]
MLRPTLQVEKKLWKKGFKRVVGLDEAGRGPLCGPVVAGAVIINDWRTFLRRRSVLPNIRDSKQLSAKQREYFYKILTKHPAIKWGIGIVSEKIIDKINILEATKLAMVKALKKIKADFLILDGKMELDLPIPQKSIIKADEKVFSCAAASIIAKVTRDRIMMRYHKKYPEYRLDLHKGYGTKLHYEMLKLYGPCQIHRKSFNI